MGWTDLIPGSSIVKGIAGIGKSWIEGKNAKTKRRQDIEASELDLEREIVRQSTGWCRLFALAFLFGPDAALLLPWITAADLSAYYEALNNSQPEWRASAKEYIVLAMWGGAELVNGGHAIGRKREKAKAKAAEKPDTAGADERPGPPGRAGR